MKTVPIDISLFAIKLALIIIISHPSGETALAQIQNYNHFGMGKACEAMALLPKKSNGAFQPSDAVPIKNCYKFLETTDAFVPILQNLSSSDLFVDFLGMAQTLCTSINTTDERWKERRIECYLAASKIITSHLHTLAYEKKMAWGLTLGSWTEGCQQGPPTENYIQKCNLRCNSGRFWNYSACIDSCRVTTSDSILECNENVFQSFKKRAAQISAKNISKQRQ